MVPAIVALFAGPRVRSSGGQAPDGATRQQEKDHLFLPSAAPNPLGAVAVPALRRHSGLARQRSPGGLDGVERPSSKREIRMGWRPTVDWPRRPIALLIV